MPELTQDEDGHKVEIVMDDFATDPTIGLMSWLRPASRPYHASLEGI